MTLAFGFHYSIGGNKTGSGDFIAKLNAAGISVMMKGASDAGLCFEAQEKGNQYGVENLLIWRATSDREDRADYWLAPSVAAAKKWGEIKNLWPPELDKNTVWWEVINEPRKEDAPDEAQPTWGNMHTTAWLGLFMVEMAKLMIPAGHKLCGPSFSSGEPEPEDWQLEGMATWLQYCADNPTKAAVSHHEYNYGSVPYSANYPWHYGRFQSIIAAADLLGIPRTFSIFLTEFGWTYQTVPSFETAVPTLTEYAKLAAKFPQLKGVALWTLQSGWGGISDQLAQWIAPDGNPFANWIINNQLETLQQPQPTVPEFGATLPGDTTQPPDGGGGEPVTTYKNLGDSSTNRLPGATHIRVAFRKRKSIDSATVELKWGGQSALIELPEGADVNDLMLVQFQEVPDEPTDPNPPQPKPYLEVEALGQRDPAWANVTLGQPTGHGKTIGNWGCLLVAYNCLARYWGLTTRLPAAENAHYVSAGAFSAQYIQPAALRTAYPDSVAYDGYLTRDSDAMRGKIRQWIDDGWPVPCRVDFNPATGQWEQHWVLVVGYIGDTDFYMMDPWHGDIAIVNDRYSIAGSDILEAIFYRPEEGDPPTPLPQPTIDVAPYFVPAAQYGPKIVMQVGNGTQPMQLEKRPSDVILRKGDGNWIDGKRYQDSEQWKVENGQIKKGKDTSDAGNGGQDGYDLGWAQWLPQFVEVGKTYHSTPTVKRFNRTLNCQVYSESVANDYLYIKKIIPTWVSPANSDIVLHDILVVEWRSGTPDLSVPPNEVYYFAKNYGYVGWGSHFIVEITQGQAPLTGALDCGM
jgi:hypothetical protein